MNQKEKKSGLKVLVFGISVISFALFLIAMYPTQAGVCSESARSCQHIADRFQPYFGIIAALLPLCLITFWMKEGVFRAWLKVAFWTIPLIILTTLWADGQLNSSGLGIGAGPIQYVLPVLIAFIALSVAFSRSLKVWFLVYKNKHIKPWVISMLILLSFFIIICIAVGIISYF